MKAYIFSWEKRALAWIEAHLFPIVLAAAAVLGVLIRLPGRDFVSGDFYYFLEPWYKIIKENGIGEQVGNYNLTYQFLILLLTKLPIPALHAYKLLSCVFDFLLAAAVGLAVYLLSGGENRRWYGLAAAAAMLLSPVAVINSSVWAQCDSIFVFFGVLAIIALLKDRPMAAMILLGLSFAFKLQAVFFLPVFLLAWFRKRQFSVLYFLLVPVSMLAAGLPTVFFGRNPLDVIGIYLEQSETYPQMAMNYPSFWQLVLNVSSANHYAIMKLPAMILALALLAVLMLCYIKRRLPTDGVSLLSMAFLLAYACVLLLPSMHERYSYAYEALAIALAVLHPRTIPLCVALHTVTLLSYAPFLFAVQPLSFPILSVLNIVIFGLYCAFLFRDMQKRADAAKAA